jgi:endonuclease/exonuclease/phosphatase family metal-dependent hydrolase
MRIVTWNCYRGDVWQRVNQLRDYYEADIVVLQECTEPEVQDESCIWFGSNPKQGVAVVASPSWKVNRGAVHEEVPDSVFPVVVDGPERWHLMAVWAKARPSYVGAILHGMDRYADFMKEVQCLMVGDFNSHYCFDKKKRKATHAELVNRLGNEFGLVSAYHSSRGRGNDCLEEPTLYWQWKESQPFHIDYCFLPKESAERILSVDIGSYESFASESDHRPLLVELAPAGNAVV